MLVAEVERFAARLAMTEHPRAVCSFRRMESPDANQRRQQALVNVQRGHAENPIGWLLAQSDRFRAIDWLVPLNADPGFEQLKATRWPRGSRVTDNATMVLAMVASWVVRPPVNKRGIYAALQQWYDKVEATYAANDNARRQAFQAQFRGRVHNVTHVETQFSANKPLLWFAEIINFPIGAPGDLRALNDNRREVAIKAQPFIGNVDQAKELYARAAGNLRDGLEGIDNETDISFTVDVLFGLLFRDMLLYEPLPPTPHLAVALDAFVGFEVALAHSKSTDLAPTTSQRLLMYQITERGEFLVNHVKDSDVLRSMLWQAAFSVYVLGRKHGIRHGDAHPGNILGRNLKSDSPLYNRPWIYVLPSLGPPGSQPRYFVLEPAMHQNKFCMLIDFDSARFLPDGSATNFSALRWDMQRVFFGHVHDNPFYDALHVKNPVRFFDESKTIYRATIKDKHVIGALVRDTIALSDASVDLDNWPVLLETPRRTVLRVPDETELHRRYPNAIVVGALLQYPVAAASATASTEDDETGTSDSSQKRSRDDDEKTEPPSKRPRLGCRVCAAGSLEAPCTQFCQAIASGQLEVARPLAHTDTAALPQRH
jgi:hypothetical protein